jgi:phosphoribosylformimino-5-aminoimidazole carboxamide ribonucleotide (ProFAR) isomerase
MLVIPSLNLEPDYSRAYAASVAESIHGWERAGFGRVQLLVGPADRALPDERMLDDILRDGHCPTQVAGKFEASEEIDGALSAGADFVVLGTRALDELDWLASAAGRFPGQLILTTPARERRARSRGAVRTLPLDLRDLASEVASLPLAGIIVEFAPDASIGHAELALLEDVAEDVEFPVQVAGGVLDLGLLRDLDFRGVSAAIITAAHLSSDFDEQELARSFSD